MDLNVFVKNVYIILLNHQYIKNIKLYGSSHNSHEILTNMLIILSRDIKYIFIHLYKEVGKGGSWSFCYVFRGPYPSEVWEALLYITPSICFSLYFLSG